MIVLCSFLLSATLTYPQQRVTSVDPSQSQSMCDAQATMLMYETPLEIDYKARPYRLIPGACELPEIRADGLVYVFKVRSPALCADDMIRSLKRLNDPHCVTPNGWMMSHVKDLIARDERTVEVHLSSRCHYFPWLMAMSPAGIQKPDGSGTGPYRLVHWWKNHEMVFARREACEFDTVRYLVVDDVSTQWLMFLKGEFDIMDDVSRDSWDAVVDKDGKLDPRLVAEGVRLVSSPRLDIRYLGINMSDPVLGPNRKLRQALNAAFDYAAWEKFYSGRIIPANGPVPPGVAGRIEKPFPYRYNLALAQQLMREAGYADGIDPKTGRRLVLTLSIGRATQDSRESGELLASFYEKIGIKLELAFHTWDAFLKAVNEGRVQLFNMGWVGDYPDAQNFLQLFYSANGRPGPNHCNYASVDFDRAYDQAMAAADEDSRNRAWVTCQEILCEDCPWVFMHVNKANALVRPRVGNYVSTDFPYGIEKYFKVCGEGNGKR